ncbi:putative transcription factor bHLH family [Helianthus annuus]|nr:putative transcription factor bHLH family [Helianthus annuus]KAJ0783841.1 putative transcription factor bHLH family [Helianthus annuus]
MHHHHHHFKLAKMDHIADYSEYPTSLYNDGNFNMFQPDFMPEPDFETLIQGVTAVESFCLDYEGDHFASSCSQLLFNDHNDSVVGAGTGIGVMDPNSGLIWNQEMEDVKVSDVFGDDDSSETATTGKLETPKGSAKGDRTRTLISERKRRSGMKEKLYALRALVPNITKVSKQLWVSNYITTED